MKLEKLINSEISLFGFNLIYGFGIGALGKYKNQDWVPIVPLAFDAVYGGIRGKGLIPYSIGVSINYLPEIYNTINSLKILG